MKDKKTAFNKGAAIFELLVFFLLGMVQKKFMVDAMYLAGILIATSAGLLFTGKIRLYEICSKKASLERSICALVLSCIFLFMMSMEEILKAYRAIIPDFNNTLFKLLFFPALLLAVFSILYWVLGIALTNKEGASTSLPKVKYLGCYQLTFVLVLIVLIFTLGDWPGQMGNDTVGSWEQIFAGQWSDWHAMGYMLYMRLCTLFVRHPFCIVIVQAFCYICLQNYALRLLDGYFKNKRVCYLYVILSVVAGVTIIKQLSWLEKDIVYMEAYFAFSLSLLEYLRRGETPKKKIYLKLAVFGILASLFRHMGFLPVLATILVVTTVRLIQKNRSEAGRIALVGAVILLSYVLIIPIFSMRILNAKENPGYVKYSVPMYIAGSLAYRDSLGVIALTEDERMLYEEVMPLEQWADGFLPYFSDSLCREWGHIGENVLKLNDPAVGKDMLLLNLKLLINHPKSYIISFFDINNLIWEIGRPGDGNEFMNYGNAEPSKEYRLRKGVFFEITEDMMETVNHVPVLRMLSARGGFSLFLLFLSVIILWTKNRKQELLSLLPIALAVTLLMISIPISATRYILPILAHSIFFTLYSWNETRFLLSENDGAVG